MYLKLFFFCICTLAATSAHEHQLRQKSKQHSIVFRGTKSQLHRLFEDNDQDSLHVLRGSDTNRFLKGLVCDDPSSNISWKCDEDTQKCGEAPRECKEECNKKHDCNNHGECRKGKCKCFEGYEDEDDCSKRDVIVNVDVGYVGNVEDRSGDCINALKEFENLSLSKLNLPSTIPVEKSKSRRSGHGLFSSKSDEGALVVNAHIVAGPNCSVDGLTAQVLQQVDASTSDALMYIDEDEDEDADLPLPFVCLVDESSKVLKSAKKEKGLENDLNVLISSCNEAGTAIEACISSKCHGGVEKDCRNELDPEKEGEHDCKGLIKGLKRCYRDCFNL